MPRPTALPFLLEPDNFTPPERTPWGGRRILTAYKSEVPLSETARGYAVVGESWEVSVEPDFPSRCADTGELLSERLRRAPQVYAGWEGDSTALLVKLLDAADDLSIQIHPTDEYAGLAPGEAGKPESWYVVDREPGAGIYLGLREGVDEGAMRRAIERGDDVSELLFFVHVEPGDFFVLEPGLAHAIGKGVTLIEPQYVKPGMRGVTYRYWDWNRRYDAEGRLDPAGKPRPLHLEHALAVTDWEGPREWALLDAVRVPGELMTIDGKGSAARVPLCGRGAPIASSFLAIDHLSGNGPLALPASTGLRALTVVDGAVHLRAPGFDLMVEKGRSAVIPHAFEAQLVLESARAILAAIAPPE